MVCAFRPSLSPRGLAKARLVMWCSITPRSQIGRIHANYLQPDGRFSGPASMPKAMLSARATGTDPLAAIKQRIGWQRLEALIEAMGQSETARADNGGGDRQLSPGYTGSRQSSLELSRSAHGTRPIPHRP
jgi:hypothetical protein